MTPIPSPEVRARYEAALEAFVAKVQQDRRILAVLLCGSLAYDQVWEKSDIDLILICEEKWPTRSYYLVENGVNIHAAMTPRSKFREALEGGLQSSFFQSLFSKSRLLFTHDESIAEFYRDDIHRVGVRDREWQLLRTGNGLLAALAKAEKWFHVKRDLHYSFLWILFTVESLAQVETLLHGEVTGREVIHQALRHNPDFFQAVYHDLIDGPKDAAAIGAALDRINAYLDERVPILFKPIFEYLRSEGGARSTTELDAYFKKKAQTDSLSFVYEWLADKGILRKVPKPLHLTEKSRVTVDEAAYYYDGE